MEIENNSNERKSKIISLKSINNINEPITEINKIIKIPKTFPSLEVFIYL